jgi:hypothetical protein
MRPVKSLAALGLLCVLALLGRADESDTAAIIDKAVKAHFPKGLDMTQLGVRTKTKGTLHILGMDLDFTQNLSMQMPTKFKDVMELTVMNMNVTVISVYNGKDAWIRSGDTDVPINDDILAEFKDAAYTIGLVQGMFLKDKALKLSSLGEMQIKGKPALGVLVSREGKKDINLYFDKTTGLMAKFEMRKRDLMSGQEVTEERFILEYQDVADRKVAKKVEVLRDGKALLEAEVLEVQMTEKLDDSEFAQPK